MRLPWSDLDSKRQFSRKVHGFYGFISPERALYYLKKWLKSLPNQTFTPVQQALNN
jgi:hypothetical protein